MKRAISKIFILWILFLPNTLVGQKTSIQLFEQNLINSEIDTVIFKLLEVHSTLLNYYYDNNIIRKIDNIKNYINESNSYSEIIKNIIKHIPNEKFTCQAKRFKNDFNNYIGSVYNSISSFKITIIKPKLKESNWIIYQEPTKPKYELRFYDNNIIYIYKRLFMPSVNILHFMDSGFTIISEKRINYLIINNLREGELTDLANSLKSYFTIGQYNIIEKAKTKISSWAKKYVKRNKTDGYIQDSCFIQIYPKGNIVRKDQFIGTTYIFAEPLSYSTATNSTAATNFYQNVKEVGEKIDQQSHEKKLNTDSYLSKIKMPKEQNHDK